MPVPDFQSLMLPLLRIVEDHQKHTLPEVVEKLATVFQLSDQEKAEVQQSGQTRLYNRTAWASIYLKRAGLLEKAGRGSFQITARGRQILLELPNRIDIKFLELRFEEFREFRSRRRSKTAQTLASFDPIERAWALQPARIESIRTSIETSLPDAQVRRAALELMAFLIEKADEKRPNAWHLRETSQGLALMAGRVVALELRKSRLRVGVIGPIEDDIRAAIGAEREDDVDFKSVPGSVLLTFPVEHAAQAQALLQDAIDDFVELFTARVRRALAFDEHVPEAVEYVARTIGRELPQPEPQVAGANRETSDDVPDEDGEISPPRAKGRAPIFEPGQRSIASLLSDIEHEVIALPDLQRPFVWEDTKVRDLLDSLFLGFPVGTLVLWHTSGGKESRAIGTEASNQRATILVIDGQQRLTSLYAVIKGAEIVDRGGSRRKIQIAFRPRDGRFEVADAAIRNDPEFVSNVTDLWSGKSKRQLRIDLINALRDKGREVDDRYEDAVEHNLESAASIADYRLPTVDIRKTAAAHDEEATEEDVAEIFVRINNQGTRLGQADFVLTLLSVFHGDLRDRLEERAHEMSRGAIVTIDTQQLLRAACAVAFDRARMSAVYRSLRGVDAVTGVADPAGREARLTQLDDAAKECMASTTWRDYLLRVRHAGYVDQAVIASKNAIVNAYAFYIRGRRSGVSKARLDELISRWIFATLLTARYSGSSESAFEQDLARVSTLPSNDGDAFFQALDDAMGETITGDYWSRTLVAALETQKARAPGALAFRAAQVVLATRALFSDQLLQNLLSPPAQGGRAASESHHLFPVAWLARQGIADRRRIHQVANLADVGWHDNNSIGAKGPADYVPRIRERLKIDNDRWARMCAEHALPLGWESMDYEAFLGERRRRMAEIIRVAFRTLGGEADAAPLTPPWFLPGAEVVWQRIADAERALRSVVRTVYSGLYADEAVQRIEHALGERDRESLERALRSRPFGADPLSIVDYLYLGQLPSLLFANEVWVEARKHFGSGPDAKQRIQFAIGQIAPVRNEIAHVREVEQARLLRATVACDDILTMVRSNFHQS